MSALTTCMLGLAFVASKSGGHLLPCVTNAQEIARTNNHEVALYLISTGSPLEKKIMDAHPEIQHVVPNQLPAFPGYAVWLWPSFIWHFAKYTYHTYHFLSQHPITKVISYGGLNSIPVCLCAKALKIPFELHELNVQPGLAIKFLSHFTDTIFTCFAHTAQFFTNHTCVLEKYPIRFTDPISKNKTLYEKYTLNPAKKVILILGGSQGSTSLNELCCRTLCEYNLADIQVIHQCGNYNTQELIKKYRQAGITAFVTQFCHTMQDLYTLADCIICRSGAGTLFECIHFNRPCITIPLEIPGNNHQLANAYALEEMHPRLVKVLIQKECSQEKLQAAIDAILVKK